MQNTVALRKVAEWDRPSKGVSGTRIGSRSASCNVEAATKPGPGRNSVPAPGKELSERRVRERVTPELERGAELGRDETRRSSPKGRIGREPPQRMASLSDGIS